MICIRDKYVFKSIHYIPTFWSHINTTRTRNTPIPTTNIYVYVYVYIYRDRYTLEEFDEVLFGIVDVVRFMCNDGKSFQYTIIWNLGQKANIYTHIHKGSEEQKKTHANLHGWP